MKRQEQAVWPRASEYANGLWRVPTSVATPFLCQVSVATLRVAVREGDDTVSEYVIFASAPPRADLARSCTDTALQTVWHVENRVVINSIDDQSS